MEFIEVGKSLLYHFKAVTRMVGGSNKGKYRVCLKKDISGQKISEILHFNCHRLKKSFKEMQKHFGSLSKISNICKSQLYLARIFFSPSKTLYPSTLTDLPPTSWHCFLFYMQKGNKVLYQLRLS